MKKQKLSLNQLQVRSFTTAKAQIKGGGSEIDTFANSCADQTCTCDTNDECQSAWPGNCAPAFQ